MRVAVIDLGTNTFNLIICDITHSAFTVLHNSKVAPKLGKEGINNGIIAPQAIKRGVDGLSKLSTIINSLKCERIIAIGTSALRNAKNSDDFLLKVKKELDIDISIIDGLQEAEYVFLGNRMAYDWGHQKALIIDIGGGSNECIICDSKEIYWKHSFENGMQRMFNSINPSYPFTPSNILEINSFLKESFSELKNIALDFNVEILVGSSGPYDTFRDIILQKENITDYDKPSFEFKSSDLLQIHKQLISSSTDEIAQIKGMDPARIELIPFASSVTQFLINEFKIPRVIQSEYSLKEGVISTLIQ